LFSPPLKLASINNFPVVLHGGSAEENQAKSALYVQAEACSHAGMLNRIRLFLHA